MPQIVNVLRIGTSCTYTRLVPILLFLKIIILLLQMTDSLLSNHCQSKICYEIERHYD